MSIVNDGQAKSSADKRVYRGIIDLIPVDGVRSSPTIIIPENKDQITNVCCVCF